MANTISATTILGTGAFNTPYALSRAMEKYKDREPRGGRRRLVNARGKDAWLVYVNVLAVFAVAAGVHNSL